MIEYEQWRNWMMQQVNRDDGIGDLAGDMQRDPSKVRYVYIRDSNGKHHIETRPIKTVFGFLRWLRERGISDQHVLRWVGIAYHEWKQKRGFVYLIRAGRHCKIGITGDITKRLASLQTATPFQIELIELANVVSPAKVERVLHEQWRCKHLRGEWFNLDNDDIHAVIDQLSDPRWQL